MNAPHRLPAASAPLSRHARHLAEHDGRQAALRALRGLLWQRDAHEDAAAANAAAMAFCEGFAEVFAGCLQAALASGERDQAAALFRRIHDQAPALLASLEA